MEWTNKAPEIPGWYWNRMASQVGIVEVRFVQDRLGRRMEVRGIYSGWRFVAGEIGRDPADWCYLHNPKSVLWCGPVEVPVIPLVQIFKTESGGTWSIAQDEWDQPKPPGRQKRKKGGT